MKRYAVLVMPQRRLAGFVYARDAAEALRLARVIWVSGWLAVASIRAR